MASSDEYCGLMARSSVIAENLPDWSIRTPSVSFLVTWSSIQLPRSGMTRQACSLLVARLDLDDEVDARASGGAG